MHLLPYTTLLAVTFAAYVPLHARQDDDTNDTGAGVNIPPYQAVAELAELAQLLADDSCKVGAEFETVGLSFQNSDCSVEDTWKAKGKSIVEHAKTTWRLTGDTGSAQGKLSAEYILDGLRIHVGKGEAGQAGADAAKDMIDWNPSNGDELRVDYPECNPWKVSGLGRNTKPQNIEWQPQITTSMPLEALYTLLKENLQDPDERNILNGVNYRNPGNPLELVTQDHFQSNQNGIDKSKVTDDVLAFCSLVLSYAKPAAYLREGESPKLKTSFMPRTEFNTLYKQVKAKIPGDLFKLFDSLACYTTDKDLNVRVDTQFCTGSASKPKPKEGKASFGSRFYSFAGYDVYVKEWIEGIGKQSPSPDLLTKFDLNIDGSIGGLDDRLEKAYESDRLVPIFEFRDLDTIPTSQFEDFMKEVDQAIQDLHTA